MRRKNIAMIAVSIILILMLSIGTLIKPDVSFSENENRYLASKPNVNIESVLSGEYEDDIETYLSEQVILRETWIKIMSRVKLILGIRDINGVYVLKNGRLVEQITDTSFNYERFGTNLANIKSLKDDLKKSIDFKVILVPPAQSVYYDNLPNDALVYDEEKVFDMAKDYLNTAFIDLREELKNADSNLFYFTDHHWSNEGIKIAYAALYGKKYSGEEIELSNTFKGTLYSKVLINKKLSDSIVTSKEAYNSTYKVTLDGKETDSIFDKSKLEIKDQYQVFFGGNYAEVDIKNPSNTTSKKLLIIKDSYANSFVPYIVDEYSEIVMIDMRYFKGNVLKLVKNFDEVLVLYSVNNFSSERIIFN